MNQRVSNVRFKIDGQCYLHVDTSSVYARDHITNIEFQIQGEKTSIFNIL